MAVHAFAQKAYNLHNMKAEGLQALATLTEGARCYLLQEAKAREAFELLTSVLDGDEDLIPTA
jgi:hypothetical protein